MITFEAGSAAVRAGETEIGGRRIAARALPYVGRAGEEPFGFDPIERVVFRRDPDGVVVVGPVHREAWLPAMLRLPAGPLLVGPGDEAGEAVWGAYSAAADAGRESGRAVYLLDPPAGAPVEEVSGEVVAILTWSPTGEIPKARIEKLAGRGVPAGFLFPLLPGWTSDRAAITAFVEQARRAGARFVAPVAPDRGGASRRAIVEARAEVAPDAAEQIFGRVHHGDWDRELADASAHLATVCSAAGLETMAPRPTGRGEPARNAAASARLEELAETSTCDEHRCALLHAAVRWIDESGRDLAAIAREGNLQRAFPFGADIAAEVERALLGIPA